MMVAIGLGLKSVQDYMERIKERERDSEGTRRADGIGRCWNKSHAKYVFCNPKCSEEKDSLAE